MEGFGSLPLVQSLRRMPESPLPMQSLRRSRVVARDRRRSLLFPCSLSSAGPRLPLVQSLLRRPPSPSRAVTPAQAPVSLSCSHSSAGLRLPLVQSLRRRPPSPSRAVTPAQASVSLSCSHSGEGRSPLFPCSLSNHSGPQPAQAPLSLALPAAVHRLQFR